MGDYAARGARAPAAPRHAALDAIAGGAAVVSFEVLRALLGPELISIVPTNQTKTMDYSGAVVHVVGLLWRGDPAPQVDAEAAEAAPAPAPAPGAAQPARGIRAGPGLAFDPPTSSGFSYLIPTLPYIFSS